MAAATLTEKGQIVIPAEIGARYQLTPGTEVEFVDEGGVMEGVVHMTAPAPAGERKGGDLDTKRRTV